MTDGIAPDELRKWPLPEGIGDEVLNKNQLARAFNVSEPTIDRWIDDGMPVLEAGTNGRSYQFQLSHCWAWKQGREHARQIIDAKAERTVQQLRLALIGGTMGDTERALPPKERAAIYAAESAWNQMARERGELVPYGELVEVIDGLLAKVRAAIEAMPDKVKREADLSPAQLRSVVATGDDILDELHRQIAEWTDEHKQRSTARDLVA